MAKLLPVILLAAFLTFVIARFSSRDRAVPARQTSAIDTSGALEVRQYWMVFVSRTAGPPPDPTTTALIQERRLANFRRLTAEGKLMVAGSLGGHGEMQGVFILNCKDSLEAAAIVKSDTAVALGQLQFTIKPWWTVKNCLFR
ncbi:hypothetical protein ACWKWU_16130 [Chitinophaga lutea]